MKKRALTKWLSLLLTIAMAMQGAFPALAAEGQAGQSDGKTEAPVFVPRTDNVIFRQVDKGATAEELGLPDRLNDGQGQEAEVTEWLSEPEYSGEPGIYVFWAVMEEGHESASAAAVVTVRQPAVMTFKSSIGGGNKPVNIYTASQLWGLGQILNSGKMLDAFGREDQAFALQKDIDLSSYGPNGENKGWMPIGTYTKPFVGTFDGNRHIISNLAVDDTESEYIGLFGMIGGTDNQGTVKNVGVVNCDIKGKNYVGSIAGYVNGNIANCFATGSVYSVRTVGGIAGYVNGSATECYTACAVSNNLESLSGSYYSVGGIVGDMVGSIENCYATGSVKGHSGNHAGGIAGRINGEITNCYATGDVSTDGYSGGIAGYIENGGTVTNCVALNSLVEVTSFIVFRVSCFNNSDTVELARNYAIDNMTMKYRFASTQPKDIGADKRDGADVSADRISEMDFWRNDVQFSDEYWQITEDMLPILKRTGANQTGEMPSHLKQLGNFKGGGDKDFPYQISSAADLINLSQIVNGGKESDKYNLPQVYYQLTADIDLSTLGEDWTPIGTLFNPFKANFSGKDSDGNYHTISNMTIDKTIAYVGLFGYVEGSTISNLGLVDCNIKSNGTAGAVVGQLNYGKITSCYSTGTVSGKNTVGGIAGRILDGSEITDCYTTCTVSGNAAWSGGITSNMDGNCKVINCYSTGAVTGSSDVGGILGYAHSSSGGKNMIENCVALNPNVTSEDDKVGRIAGAEYTPFDLLNNYAYSGMEIIGSTDLRKGEDKMGGADATSAEIATADFWENTAQFDGNIWKMENGRLPVLRGAGGDQTGDLALHLRENGYFNGTGTENDPYEICTAEELAMLASIVNGAQPSDADYNKSGVWYRLMEDIDLSRYAVGAGWTLIGSFEHPFVANFDGNDKTVSNLTINDGSGNSVGLFGYIENSSVSNLGIAGCNVKSDGTAGGIAGRAEGESNIENCWVTGTVAGGDVGCIAGSMVGSITNCYSTGSVSGTQGTGGIAGYVKGSVTNCYSTGSVSGYSYVGGIVGQMNSGNNSITNCYATGSVSGTNEVGGIAGSIEYCSITNSAALNSSIGGPAAACRIANDSSSSTLSDNYAFEGMQISYNITSDANGPDGANIGIPAVTTSSFWEKMGFDVSGAWELSDGEMPVLKGVTGIQPLEPPLHLIGFAKDEIKLETATQEYSVEIPQEETSITFTVSGMEGWTDSKIEWGAADGLTISEKTTSSAILTVPAGRCKAVTVSAINLNSGKTAESRITFNVPKPDVEVKATATVDLGGSINLTAEVTPKNGVKGTTYEWYRNTSQSNTGGTLISTEAADTDEAKSAGTVYYYCVVTNTNDEASGNKTATTTSDVISVKVNIAKPEMPQVTPDSSKVNVGGKVTLSAAAKTEPYSGVTRKYVWYKNTDNSTIGGEEIAGATSDKLTVEATAAGTTYYYCQIKDSQNSESALSEMSNVVSVTAVDASLVEPDAPTITMKPESGKVNKGGTIVLTATLTPAPAAGVTRTYEWYKEDGTSMLKSAENTFTPNTDTAGDTTYYCKVTDSKKDADDETVSKTSGESNRVTVMVIDADLDQPDAPTITMKPESGKVNKGGTIVLTAALTPAPAAGVTRTYEWYKEDGTPMSKSTSNTFEPKTETVGNTTYYCKVTDSKKDADDKTVSITSGESNRVTVTVIDADLDQPGPPTITMNPESGKVNKGEKIVLTATLTPAPAAGVTRTYEWYKEDGTLMLQSAENTFTPNTNTVGDTTYYCKVTDSKKDADDETVSTTSGESNRVKVTVADSGTDTPSGGGGGSSAPATPVDIGVIEVKDADGKVIGSFDTSKLSVAEGTMNLNIEKESGQYAMMINVQWLKDMAAKYPQGILHIKTPGAVYELPFDAGNIAGLDEFMQMKNLKAKEVYVKLILGKLAGEELKQAQDDYAARFQGGQTVTDFYDISVVFCTASGRKIGFEPVVFNNRVTFGLPATDKVSGGFIYNKGQFAFAPMKWQSDMAMFSTLHHSIYVAGLNDMKFTDIGNHWGEDIIREAANKGLVSGMGDASYAPDNSVTRAQLITMIANALNLPEYRSETKKYADVVKTHWSYDSVMRLKSAGMLDMYAGENLMPDKAASRQEMAALLSAAAKYEDKSLKSGNTDLSAVFSDADSIDEKYADDVKLVYELGIMQGKGESTFGPQDTTTRAQAATVLLNMLRALGLI